MGHRIRKVAVLGAGVMGSGIAAHLANCGIRVLLLDIVPPKAGPRDDPDSKAFRNRFALTALVNLKTQKPAPLTSVAALEFIEPGNFEDDLSRIAECDWVVEVVKEEMSVKQSLFSKVEQHARKDTIISSNTSGLSIAGMTHGRSPEFRERFLVTHFFNPVRYMRLLELVPGEHTRPDVIDTLRRFGEEVMGKGIVFGKDTTNFVANRIGIYSLLRAVAAVEKDEVSIEEVDKIMGTAMGRPKSGVFRTSDVVGLDTLIHVSKNCYDTLKQDEEREVFNGVSLLQALVNNGALGEKSGQGFYKKQKSEGGATEIWALDPKTLEYRPPQKVRFDSLGAAREVADVRERTVGIMKGGDKASRFAERSVLETLAYASRRIPEIADDVVNVDRALRWGFGWELGPFEQWDAYGVREGVDRMNALGIAPAPWVLEMLASGRQQFYSWEGTQLQAWSSVHKKVVPVEENSRTLRVDTLRRVTPTRKLKAGDSATLWDMGDEVLLLEFHSKMNSIDDDIVAMMHQAIDEAEKSFRGIVIGNDGDHFSAGANIMALLMSIRSDDFESVDRMVRAFQMANQRMRYCAVPVVTAPFGLTLGGGAEATMGGNAIQAYSELYMGLVEFGVGLIPGGGGSMQLLRNIFGPYAADRNFDALPFLKKVFLSIGTAKVSTSAEEAREMGYLTRADGITFHRDFLLSDAKARVLGMSRAGFSPPRPTSFFLPGKSGYATIDMMLYDMQLTHQISEHDRKIARALARVITGGDTSPSVPVSEARLLDLEAEAFLSLCGEAKSQDRIQHMLEKGKPLRN